MGGYEKQRNIDMSKSKREGEKKEKTEISTLGKGDGGKERIRYKKR